LRRGGNVWRTGGFSEVSRRTGQRGFEKVKKGNRKTYNTHSRGRLKEGNGEMVPDEGGDDKVKRLTKTGWERPPQHRSTLDKKNFQHKESDLDKTVSALIANTLYQVEQQRIIRRERAVNKFQRASSTGNRGGREGRVRCWFLGGFTILGEKNSFYTSSYPAGRKLKWCKLFKRGRP